MTETLIQEAWTHVERIISANNPKELPALNPPATNEELENLERALGFPLPSDLLDSLRIHNGESETLGLTLALDCDRIIHEYGIMLNVMEKEKGLDFSRHSPDSAVQDVLWDPKWVPVAADGGGNLWCIDMNPTANGRKQQIIFWDHEGSCDVEAESLANFLVHQANEVDEDAEWLEDDGILSVEY